MSKSIYEEALKKSNNYIGTNTEAVEDLNKIREALKQAQKQEKLLNGYRDAVHKITDREVKSNRLLVLYKELYDIFNITVNRHLLHNYFSLPDQSNVIKLKIQIKELEK